MPVPVIGPLSIYILPSSINVNSISITVDGSSDTFNSSISGEYLLLETRGDYNWNDTHTISVSCDGYSTTSGTTDTDGKVYITLQQVIFISKLSNGTTTYTIKDAEARASISSLATVATTGAYSDLSGTPTIPIVDQTYDATSTNAQAGIAVASGISTAVSGKVDKLTSANRVYITNSSSQQSAIEWNSGNAASTVAVRDSNSQLGVALTPTANTHATSKKYVDDGLGAINGKIPSAATTTNQLADKAFVNSSINAIAAYYITSNAAGDGFATKAALTAGPYYHDGTARTPTENDYAIVAADETHSNACTRYSYTGSQWSFQYVVNDTPFTQAQIDAINSGINSTMVGYLTNVTSDIQTQLNGKQASITGGASTITSSNLTANRSLISNGSGKVAVSDTTSTELGYVHGVTSAIQTQIDSKLNKLTYEWNNAISFGSTGKLCIGKFCCYDSNITIDIDATTSTTYHGTLVIALQNMGTSGGGQMVATVYGDAANTIAPNLYIYKHNANDCLVEVYFSPLAWSKNIIHIRAVSLNKDHGSASYDSVAFDLCTSVSEIPAEATIKPTNALDSKQATLVSGTNIKTINSTTLLGSGNISITGLPSQTSQSGKFLTTDGTTASWSTISQVPSQSGNSGKFLTTNGTTASWAEISEYTANEVETLWNSL